MLTRTSTRCEEEGRWSIRKAPSALREASPPAASPMAVPAALLRKPLRSIMSFSTLLSHPREVGMLQEEHHQPPDLVRLFRRHAVAIEGHREIRRWGRGRRP